MSATGTMQGPDCSLSTPPGCIALHPCFSRHRAPLPGLQTKPWPVTLHRKRAWVKQHIVQLQTFFLYLVCLHALISVSLCKMQAQPFRATPPHFLVCFSSSLTGTYLKIERVKSNVGCLTHAHTFPNHILI